MKTEERFKLLLGATSDTLAAVDKALAGQIEPERPTSLRLLRMGEAAKETNLSRCTIWRSVRDGRLRAVEIRKGSFRIPEAELIRFCGGVCHA